MISSEVQRTLVKSPPELWAELSDPAALARHLGELGEIRITRTEPEKLVEWEAEGTKGTVAIKASGWGTKVTLSVSRELPTSVSSEPEAVEAEAQDAVEPEGEAEAEMEPEQADQPSVTAAERFAHDDPEPLLGTPLGAGHGAEDVEPREDDRADASSGPVAESPEPTEARRGFLARLFGRRRKHAEPVDPAPILDDAAQSDPSPEPQTAEKPLPAEAEAEAKAKAEAEAEAEAIEDPEPAPVEAEVSVPDAEVTIAEHDSPATSVEHATPEPVADIAAELKKAEEAASEEVTAVLTGVLDRLGAAHHRPFSRA